MKQCPFRWGNSAGNAARCVSDKCAFWLETGCAIVIIAKTMSENYEENDEDG